MQYNYSLRKSHTGVSYISFLNFFDKKEFLNDFLKALLENNYLFNKTIE